MVIGDLPHKVKSLHEEYGEVVRVAPDELSFTNPAAWRDIYPKNFVRPREYKDKPPGKNAENFISASEPDHARFRKILAPAFSEKSTHDQEPVIKKHLDVLIRKLYQAIEDDSSGNSGAVEVVSWFNYAAFDITSDLVWSSPFGCLEEVRYHPWIEVISQFKVALIVGAFKFYSPLDDIINFITPKSALEPVMRMWKTTEEKIEQRLDMDSYCPDMISHVVAANESSSSLHMSRDEIDINTMMIVGAGSESVTTILTGVTNYLVREPAKLQTLVHEIRTTFRTEDDMNGTSLSRLPYLNAVLHEGMRLCPTISDGMRRTVPKGGASVAGYFLPEGTVVSIPQWATYQSPENFHLPTAFLPERWLPESSDSSSPYCKDRKDAFNPFSLGPHNCPGKNVGYLELRLILARIVWNFDMSIPTEMNLPEWGEQKIYWFWDKKPTWIKLRSAR